MKWWMWLLLAVLLVLIIIAIIWFLRTRKTSPAMDDQPIADETPTGRIPALGHADIDTEPDDTPATQSAPTSKTAAAQPTSTAALSTSAKPAAGTLAAQPAKVEPGKVEPTKVDAEKVRSRKVESAKVDSGKAQLAKVESGSFPNSAMPLADGSAPSAEFTIKGNAGSMLYHTKESPYYSRTKAEVWFRTPEDAEAAGFTGWNKRRAAAKVIAGPYPGSAMPVAGGDAPTADFIVKGNADSMLYHTKESPFFSATKAEVWFKSTVDAEKAGFHAWRN